MSPVVPASHPAVTVAAFDFDGTLTYRDSLLPYLARGLGWPRFLQVLALSAPWLAAYALRLMRNDVAKARLLHLALAGKTEAELDGWTRRWLAQDLPAQLRPWAMQRLAQHRQAGHVCVIVSASPQIYLGLVAEQLGFDALICTEMAWAEDRLTGHMRTPNCHGEQKVLRLKAWLDQRFGALPAGALTLHAYGDTSGDKPMLRMAQHAWYRGQPWQQEPATR